LCEKKQQQTKQNKTKNLRSQPIHFSLNRKVNDNDIKAATKNQRLFETSIVTKPGDKSINAIDS
jgi:hypothetical protein